MKRDDNMTEKKIIRLTESQLREMISESVKKMLNEIGDTNRGQYMLGRLHRRHNTDADYLSGVDSQARKFNKGNWEVFDQGYNDEGISNALDKSNTIRRNYGVYKMNDMDKVGRKFIEFIEKNDLALQLIVDYMSGNQNGTKYSSPLPELIPQFEDEVLGYECSNEMKKAIEKAFNEWWYYAESQLIPEEMNESKKKNIKLTESQLKELIYESVKKILKESMFDEDEFEIDDIAVHNAIYYAEEIENGVYDDKLTDEDWRDNIIYRYGFDMNNDGERIFDDAIKNRLMVINKDYAWKQINLKRKQDKASNEWHKNEWPAWGPDANTNIRELPYKRNGWLSGNDREMSKDYMKLQGKDAHSKMPEMFRKDGNLRTPNQILKGIQNKSTYIGAAVAAEKKPLHTKGSANRDLIAIDKQRTKNKKDE